MKDKKFIWKFQRDVPPPSLEVSHLVQVDVEVTGGRKHAEGCKDFSRSELQKGNGGHLVLRQWI